MLLGLPGTLARAAEPSVLGGLETFGEDQLQGKLPEPPRPGQIRRHPSGLTLDLDASWGGDSGYRPMRVKITPLAPLSSPRELTIRFYGGAEPEVTQQIEVPAGLGGANAIVSLPQQGGCSVLQLDVYEDGKRIDELSAPEDPAQADVYRSRYGNYAIYNSGRRVTTNPVMLLGFPDAEVRSATSQWQTAAAIANNQWSFIFADVPDAPALNTMPTSGAGIQQLGAIMYGMASSSTGTAALNSSPFLSDRWIDNSAIDHFVLSLDEARRLSRNFPANWAAIRKATAAGATMCIYGIDKNWQRLDEVEALLAFPDAVPTAHGDKGNWKSRGWAEPDEAFDANFAPTPVNIPNFAPMTDDSDDAPTPVPPVIGQPPIVRSGPGRTRAAFLMRPFFRGRVMAVTAVSPSDAVKFIHNWLIDTAGGRKLDWSARHGLFLDPRVTSANKADFWEFVIPGVGLTPVTQFIVLISLFVLGIGPINYWLLRRWHRLNLLVITVPTSAAIVTAALLLYAIVGDGLGVRARVRSFTEIDCRSGEAVCWSRLSFYAGISPSSGLQFPDDVAVYPFQQESLEMMRSVPQHGITWYDLPQTTSTFSDTSDYSMQHWSKDWLPGRTPTQFLTVRVRKTPARLDVRRVEGSGGSLEVVNRLGTRIQQIVATDADGYYFRGGEISDGDGATLRPDLAKDALIGIRKTLSDNDLELPPGSQLGWFRDSYDNNRQYGYRYSYPISQNYAPNQSVSQREGILEQSLREWSKKLAPRTFVAIVDRSPEVVLGVESAREEASLHVVAGHW